jgi:glucan phosphoethanolaminetransferase (alkaline phosphatase superfamily)
LIIIPFLLLGLPIAVIAFIIIAALKWKQEGGENVFRQLYIHLVLFATLMLSIGGGIGIFTGLSDLISPTPYYETYNSFKQMKTSQLKDANQTLSEEQIRTEYDNNIEDNKERTKQEALNTVIRSLGFIIIPLPIFFYFNRGREKEKKDLVK